MTDGTEPRTASEAERTGILRRLLELPIHPFLFGAYAVLFLWARNVGKVKTADVTSPFLYVMVGTAVLVAIGWAAYRNVWKSAVVVSILSFLFFSFGHITSGVRSAAQADVPAPPHQGLWLIVWGVVALAAIVVAFRVKADGRRLAFGLNLVLGVLVALSVFTIGSQKLEARREAKKAASFAAAPGAGGAAKPAATATPAAGSEQKRDVYYLVIEEYPNEQTLREEYGFDNRPFLNALRERGFYIPSKMRAPYPKTPHSVSSTVNLDYLSSFPKDSKNWQIVYDSLKHSKVAQKFQAMGYKYILIGSGFHAIRHDDTADENPVYDPKAGPVQTEFGQVLYDSTVLAAIASRYNVGSLDERYKRYQEVMYMYQRSAEIPRDPAPTFSFLHIETTHSPYVIDHKGHFMSQQRAEKMTSHEAYIESLRYSNTRALELIDKIQKSYPADKQPIIVYQADEGPGPVGWNPNTKEHFDWTTASQKVLDLKFRIFSSYYLPGLRDTGLYPTISTTNSFRLIFNKYFGGNYTLLPDRSYVFRNELAPYDFIDVTDRVKN